MLVTNEFITLKAFQYKFSLTTASVALEMKRNSEYFFNTNGFYIKVYPTRESENLDAPKRFLWYPSYRKTTTLITGDTLTLLGETYSVVVSDSFQEVLDAIELFTENPEIDRAKRTYSDLCHIIVFQLESSVEVDAENIKDTSFIFEIKLPISTTPLPLPFLKSFNVDLIGSEQGIFSWKGTNPGDFYYYELWDSWNPYAPIFRQRINSATGLWTHNFPPFAKGKYNIFTLKIVREGIIYQEKEIRLLLPREDFNIFTRTDRGVHTPRNPQYPSLGLKNLDSIFVLSRDQSNNLIKTKVAYVYMKVGGQWYTD